MTAALTVDPMPAIARKRQIPVTADIHFQPEFVLADIEVGWWWASLFATQMSQSLNLRPGELEIALESQIVETLIDAAVEIAETMRSSGGEHVQR
jgi:4-hydroxy-3-methylbut-2-en-1-yl diphosphate synthase IspG/GcpE